MLYLVKGWDYREIFPCERRQNLRARVNDIEVMYERPREKRESWARFNFYFYAWPFIHCLYFIYARNI